MPSVWHSPLYWQWTAILHLRHCSVSHLASPDELLLPPPALPPFWIKIASWTHINELMVGKVSLGPVWNDAWLKKLKISYWVQIKLAFLAPYSPLPENPTTIQNYFVYDWKVLFASELWTPQHEYFPVCHGLYLFHSKENEPWWCSKGHFPWFLNLYILY